MNEESKLFGLDGRVALVTGAAGHLGSEISCGLAEAGAHVVLCGRNIDKLNELSKKLASQNHSSTVEAVDVTNEEAVQSMIDRIGQTHRRLDVIVNNAHSGRTGTVETTKRLDFEDVFRINVVAANTIIASALPLLEDSGSLNPGGASIINIASMYGMVSPDPSIYGTSDMNSPPSYGAAKAGLIQLTRYLACHLASRKIRVNSVSPGPFPKLEVSTKNPEFIEKLKKKNPSGRIGAPSELRGPIVFLASDASSYVTGANLPVDGGWTAW